jgi:uncharacterized metal-binding protein
MKNAPPFCPTNRSAALIQRNVGRYTKRGEDRQVTLATDFVNAKGNRNWTRIQEVIEFSKKIGAHKLGVAFCVGLKDVAEVLCEILEAQGFDVASVACMVGQVRKTDIGIHQTSKERPVGVDLTTCNPISQAEILNKENVQLNIMVGLCVGHDALFIKYAKALVTPLIVKDKVTCHNPIGPLIAYNYYRYKLPKGGRPQEAST